MKTRQLAVLVGMAVLSACNSDAPVADGKTLYEAHCRTCHGEAGKLKLICTSKSLAESKLDLEQRLERIRRGRGGSMPMFDTILSDQEIKNVAEYTMTLK